jgi:hypothetical protein
MFPQRPETSGKCGPDACGPWDRVDAESDLGHDVHDLAAAGVVDLVGMRWLYRERSLSGGKSG